MDEFTNLFESFDSISITEPSACHSESTCSVPTTHASSSEGDAFAEIVNYERDGGGYYNFCVIA